MKQKYERLKEIEVVRTMDNETHILGKSDLRAANPYLHHIVVDSSKGNIVAENSFRVKYSYIEGAVIFFNTVSLGLRFLYRSIPFIQERLEKKGYIIIFLKNLNLKI